MQMDYGKSIVQAAAASDGSFTTSENQALHHLPGLKKA